LEGTNSNNLKETQSLNLVSAKTVTEPVEVWTRMTD